MISALDEQFSNPCPLAAALGHRDLPFLFPLQESRQIMVHRDVVLGGIFMTPEQELEVIRWDLARMDKILNQQEDNLVYLDECNIFTIAHARAHGVRQADEFWSEYLLRLEKLQASVIFLNVSLQVSWERRHHRYEQRLVCFPEAERVKIMGQYYEYLKKLGPQLSIIFEKLPLPKKQVDGSLPKTSVVKLVSRALAELISGNKKS
jgi:hypothetical protein